MLIDGEFEMYLHYQQDQVINGKPNWGLLITINHFGLTQPIIRYDLGLFGFAMILYRFLEMLFVLLVITHGKLTLAWILDTTLKGDIPLTRLPN